MISQDDMARIQQQLGEFAVASLRIDLDGFLEAAGTIGSPQALSHDFAPRVVASAGEWAELALLLKPFRDEAVQRIGTIREEAHADVLVSPEAACPSCSERRFGELLINEDGSALCTTCGRRYELPGKEEDAPR